MDIYRLTYVSTARPALLQTDLDAIGNTARQRNAPADITGLLAFNGTNFMQTLEGPRASVEAVMAAIAADPRHSGLIVISTETVAKRAFEDWAMQVISLTAPPIGQGNGFGEAQMPLGLPEQLRRMYASFTSLGQLACA